MALEAVQAQAGHASIEAGAPARNPVIAWDIPKKPEPLPKFPGRPGLHRFAFLLGASDGEELFGEPTP